MSPDLPVAATRRRMSFNLVRGEFGPLLQAALPGCTITTVAGETRITAPIRDEAEWFRILERVRNLGASLVSVFGGAVARD